jgi:hypothetical protein
MAIYRLLRNSTLEPEEISRITEAYEQALHTLCVKDRDDLLTEMIAKQIIKIARAGVHDAAQRSGSRRTTHPVRPPLLAASPRVHARGATT